MRILITFPGKHGDLLWSLPTVRAVSEHFGEPVDLLVSSAYGSTAFLSLLQVQPYIKLAGSIMEWPFVDGKPLPPGHLDILPAEYDRVYHLGYDGWPQAPLPMTVHARLWQQWQDKDGPVPTLDLDRPWITPEWVTGPYPIVVAWNEFYFELKVGLEAIIDPPDGPVQREWANLSTGPRWQAEYQLPAVDWMTLAASMATAKVILCDCSAPHVLAVALGKPVLVMEPCEDRWNPIFWPFGMDGPRVKCIKGLDGRPTFDARHVKDEIEKALQCS